MPKAFKSYTERFNEKLVKRLNGCWEWTAGLNYDGYGCFCYNGNSRPAHRFSYTLHVGIIPEEIMVLHKCNNRKCVNPEHLYLGNNSNNMMDCVASGNFHSPFSIVGEDHPGTTKLTNNDVISIKCLLRDGVQQILIADMYNIDRSNISRINTGKIWSHIKLNDEVQYVNS